MLIRFCPLSVLSTIQLYDQTSFEAAEVDDKVPDRILAPEFGARDLTRAQARPKFLFHFGLVAA